MVLNAGDTGPKKLRLAAPPADLAGLVREFWQVERHAGESAPWYLPVPGFELVFCGEGSVALEGQVAQRGPFGLLAPPRHRPERLRPAASVTLWGARLEAHALAHLGWCDAAAARVFPPLAGLLRGERGERAARVLVADGFEARCEAMAELLRAPRGAGEGAGAVELSRLRGCMQRGELPVERSAQRALQRAFARWVGMSPTDWRVLHRFDEAVRGLLAEPARRRELGALAAHLGYSDQAHLTRHFRRFAWASPARFQGEVDAWLRAP